MTLSGLFTLPSSMYVASVVTFAVSVLLVFTKRWYGHFSIDGLVSRSAKNHSTPKPPIGGVAVFAVLLANDVQDDHPKGADLAEIEGQVP